MKEEALAPVVLFVYNRLEHTKQTVMALQKNKLASNSELFVFSDGYKDEKTKEQVLAVRRYISTITGFKHVYIKESTVNKGLSYSVIEGVSEVLSRFDKVIVLEDDLITATDFLEYMNHALNKYKDNFKLFSISGYTFPSPYIDKITEDVFLYPRPASWGWATWQNRWNKADWEMKDFSAFSKDKKAIQSFLRGGEDMYIMLLKQQKGLIQSWAIRWTYVHFKHHAYSLYLKKSKVKSIGTDNSGTNLPQTKKYDTNIHVEHVVLPDHLMEDRDLINLLKDFYKPSFVRKIINTYKYGTNTWLKAR